MSPVVAIYLLWGFWFIAWLAATAVTRHERGSLHGRLAAAFHLCAALALLFLLMIVSPWPGTDLQYRLWERAVADDLGWYLFSAAALSFSFSTYVSVHRILRRRHTRGVIDTGPYRVVRHPLYLGLIIAAFETTAIFGRPTSLFGAVLLTAALIAKVHVEERSDKSAAARAYRTRVPMLIPFWPMPGRRAR